MFLATLIQNHIYAFNDLGATLLELWVLSITKPFRLLQYENYLAGFLKQNDLPFLQRAFVPATAPDYSSNRDYFLSAIHHMRKALREAGSSHARQLREEYKGTLLLVMKKMKQDLHELVSSPPEHKTYMQFVRQAVSLIKSHGVGICVVDPFFTQPSLEYSPPLQDPQLHVDGIIGYGVKIGEKDPAAVPQLFHYLYNNFKIALANDKLKDESRILERAMVNPEVVSFMLQFMLPAIVDATARVNEAWLLLDTYVAALGSVLTRSCIPMELRGEDIEHSVELLGFVVAWFLKLRERDSGSVSLEQVHIISELIKLSNAQQSSLQTWLCSPLLAKQECEEQPLSSQEKAKGVVTALGDLAREATRHLRSILTHGAHQGEEGVESLHDGIQLQPLLAGLSRAVSTDMVRNPRVTDFANHIVADVKRTWVVAPCLVTIRMAGKPGSAISSTPSATGSQSRNGTSHGPWNEKEVVQKAYEEMGRWRLEVPESESLEGRMGRGRGRRERSWQRAFDEDDVLF